MKDLQDLQEAVVQASAKSGEPYHSQKSDGEKLVAPCKKEDICQGKKWLN